MNDASHQKTNLKHKRILKLEPTWPRNEPHQKHPQLPHWGVRNAQEPQSLNMTLNLTLNMTLNAQEAQNLNLTLSLTLNLTLNAQ